MRAEQTLLSCIRARGDLTSAVVGGAELSSFNPHYRRIKKGKIKGFFSQEKTKIQRETLLEDKKCVERVL